MEKYLEHTKVFKALGDPKRAMIVDMLSCGELCACMILEKFEMSQSTLSHHMKLLCECGLVKGREEGKWIEKSSSLVSEATSVRVSQCSTLILKLLPSSWGTSQA